MLMTCSQFCHITDKLVQYRFAHNSWNTILATKTQLSCFIISPRVHLTKLIDGKSMGISTHNFLDQLILQRYQQSWMQNFQALHRAQLLPSNKIFETQLSILISAPSIKKAKDLSFTYSTNFLAEELRIRTKMSISSLSYHLLLATSIAILTQLVV